ncbi:MAG: type II CAAX endopeptidase family protein [Pseudomonadota bacterium]
MTPFEAYVRPALQRPGWWRPIAGALVILCFWVVITFLVLGGYTAYLIVTLGDPEAGIAEMGKLVEGGTPERVLIMILTFAGVWVGVFLAMAFFHGQEFPTIFSPDRRRRPGGFMAGLVLSLCYLAIPVAAGLIFATPVRTEVSLQVWALWLIPLLPLIFVQATGEELIFRGYFLQQLGARIRSPLVWAFLPAFIFGCLHISNAPSILGSIYYVSITTVMGLVFATLVWRTGSLWTAAGLHVGNNVIGLTIIGPDGVLAGTQLWVVSQDDMNLLFPVNLGMAVLLLIFLISPMGRIFGDGRRLIEPQAAV